MISPAEIYFAEHLYEEFEPLQPESCVVENISSRAEYSAFIQIGTLEAAFELLRLQEGSLARERVDLYCTRQKYAKYSAFIKLYEQFIDDNEMLFIRIISDGDSIATACCEFFRRAKPARELRFVCKLKIGDKQCEGHEELRELAKSYWIQVNEEVMACGGDFE